MMVQFDRPELTANPTFMEQAGHGHIGVYAVAKSGTDLLTCYFSLHGTALAQLGRGQP